MRKLIVIGVFAAVVLGLAGFGLWLWRLPPGTVAPPIVPAAAETEAVLEALRPRRDGRPVVAVIGLNDATETTDYLLPPGILRRADIADVTMLATAARPVKLFPALTVEPDATIEDFDAEHPAGADYVIVPAMSRDDDPAVLAWIREQSAKGAIIIGVCAGAKVVAAAGLLDGKRATTHWYYRDQLLKLSPTTEYVPDRRFVVDAGVVTTTGISASMPMMLTLIEAIAGPEKAAATARGLGVESWDARHASEPFTFTRPFATTVLANTLSFWNRDSWAIELQPGMDEASLALIADAWSRTYRSKAFTFTASGSAITTANDVKIVPDTQAADRPEQMAPLFPDQPPAKALDLTLAAIGALYGQATADVVAMQLEYPKLAAAQ